MNISHCIYRWSSVSYSFVYIMEISLKLLLVTKKIESASSYVQARGVTTHAPESEGLEHSMNGTYYIITDNLFVLVIKNDYHGGSRPHINRNELHIQ